MSSKELSGTFAVFDTNTMESEAREESTYLRTGRAARTLVKTHDMNIALIVMRSGDHIQEHDARGAVSIFVKNGKIEVGLPEESVTVNQGEVLVLERGTPHDVRALEDCAFVLTIGLLHSK